MKTKITLKVDNDLLREAKTMAAEERMSTASFLVQQLEQLVRQRKEHLEQLARKQREYSAARRRALARLREAEPRGWQRPSSRDELHER